ncbi:Multidrug resistance associated protein 7 [Fasciola hepatica]|uniref:Multidrug resistance associated protein 7 n=1 Tax=Fasciola hepatica TaxID=6192 RepID=A0A4E0RJE0_FASHE|nr:Multidrug resistance associated protein 7 [Fasciola hepatica]
MLIGPMNAFPWVINGVIEAIVSIRRLVGLLSLPAGRFPCQLTSGQLQSEQDVNPISTTSAVSEDLAVDLQNTSFYWSDPRNPVLSNISLKVKKGQLACIVGPVGSGKSALLLSILGELQSVSGYDQTNILLSCGYWPRYAYVSQTPWICSGTVRENIVFGLPVDPVRLDQIVEACALGPDLASFPHGLDTNVGEAGGSRLSGGQRARIALARAVYQDADVYLLDDPLAALDVHVGKHVLDQCLLGLLADKTRLITAHQCSWLASKDQSDARADIILEMRGGRISSTLYLPNDSSGDTRPPTESEDQDVALLEAEMSVDEMQSDAAAPGSNGNQEAEDWERLAFGSIDSSVYWTYIKSVGYWLAFGVLFFLVLMQGTRNAADWWLARWVRLSDSASVSTSIYLENVTTTQLGLFTLSNLIRPVNSEPTLLVSPDTNMLRSSNRSFYLTVYGSIVGVNVLATTFRAVLFAFGGLAAAAIIHGNALDTVLHARVSFFDRTPQGRILNRFSSDVNTVDDSLPFILNIFLACIAGLIGVVVITCLSLPLLLSVVLPLTFAFWSVQRVYRCASRDLKRLSSVTRSPLYAHFSDTISGLAVIRGLRQELRFRHLTAKYLGTQIRAELASLAAGSWLSVRLQIMAAGIVAGVVLLSLLGRELGWTEITAAGLSAAYALNIASLMTSTVYVATETEKNLIAVERCQELTEETPVESDTVPITVTAPSPIRRHGPPVFRPLNMLAAHTNGFVPPDWPSTGRVEFRNISLTYRRVFQSTNQAKVQALKNISFTIEPRDRVGIVGRTGSGKSSLLRVLLRLVDHLPGPHTNEHIAQQIGFVGVSGQVFIDGVDIRTVSLVALRTYILAVSQEPFLFSGCLRDNLDPEGVLSDEDLCEVLIKCQLAATQLEASAMLSLDVGEAGRDISAGQRQLVCLARTLLRQPRPKIICFDEATASIDTKAEEAIHEIMNREFSEATVLLIAHRLSSVRRLCSRVLVMQSGCLVADGAPEQILADDKIQLADDDEPHDLIDL